MNIIVSVHRIGMILEVIDNFSVRSHLIAERKTVYFKTNVKLGSYMYSLDILHYINHS